jgi:hypothetical protein
MSKAKGILKSLIVQCNEGLLFSSAERQTTSSTTLKSRENANSFR